MFKLLTLSSISVYDPFISKAPYTLGLLLKCSIIFLKLTSPFPIGKWVPVLNSASGIASLKCSPVILKLLNIFKISQHCIYHKNYAIHQLSTPRSSKFDTNWL